MNKLAQLCADIVKLLERYGASYVTGIWNTLILALVATAIGCLIGFVCGVLNTIPYSKNDPLPKRFLLKLVRVLVRGYVEIFRGTPFDERSKEYRENQKQAMKNRNFNKRGER